MPRYAVDFIADIEELTDYPGSEHDIDYPISEIKAENNGSETAMGNVQCLFTVGERPQNRRVVISRGTQCEKTVQPEVTSVRQENISSYRGGVQNSDYTSQVLQSMLNTVSASTTSNEQQEEVIMGRLSNELPFKQPPDLKDNERLKNKREQLLQKLKIDAAEEEPASLSDTLTDLDLKCELQERIRSRGFYDTKTVDIINATAPDACRTKAEDASNGTFADVFVVAAEAADEFNNVKNRMETTSYESQNLFNMSERGDSGHMMMGFPSEDLEKHLYVNESNAYDQNSSNIENAKTASPSQNPRLRHSTHGRRSRSRKMTTENKSQLSNLYADKMMTDSSSNYSPMNVNEATPLINLPPKPPRYLQATLNPHQLERPTTAQRFRSQTPRNQSNIGSAAAPIEEVIEHNLVSQGAEYNLDIPPINSSRSPCPPGFPTGDYAPAGVRPRSLSEPRGINSRSFYYPSRIPQPVTHKFFVCETDGIGDILADTTDRRIKAVCDRHRCDIAIYSPIVRGGYMKYIVMLTAPSASEMKKCVRSLDTTLKWNLSSQLK